MTRFSWPGGGDKGRMMATSWRSIGVAALALVLAIPVAHVVAQQPVGEKTVAIRSELYGTWQLLDCKAGQSMGWLTNLDGEPLLYADVRRAEALSVNAALRPSDCSVHLWACAVGADGMPGACVSYRSSRFRQQAAERLPKGE